VCYDAIFNCCTVVSKLPPCSVDISSVQMMSEYLVSTGVSGT
jgi:hypothetical protein